MDPINLTGHIRIAAAELPLYCCPPPRFKVRSAAKKEEPDFQFSKM